METVKSIFVITKKGGRLNDYGKELISKHLFPLTGIPEDTEIWSGFLNNNIGFLAAQLRIAKNPTIVVLEKDDLHDAVNVKSIDDATEIKKNIIKKLEHPKNFKRSSYDVINEIFEDVNKNRG